MSYIKQESRDGVIILVISRPEAMNALNSEILEELHNKILELEGNDSIKCFILTGEGKSFVAGADIAAMAKMNFTDALKFSQQGQEVFNSIENSKLVSIACINGFALGGGMELALSCDIRYASNKSKFGLPEVSLGLIPGFGGTQRLSRLCGTGIASEYILSGDMYSSEDAYNHGIVSKLVEPDNLLTEGIRLAKSIQSRGSIAIQIAKQSLRTGLGLDFESGLKIERENFASLFNGDESKEGIQAFLEKRKPNF